MLYLLFLLSGVSGLIYQVVWVRVFGNVFGNTIYSASLVVAVFMLGLGVGSYAVGAWADRRYAARPDSLLRAYAAAEGLIGALGLAVSLSLPHLGQLSAALSSYSREPSGWYALSASSYLARGGLAVIVLAPITLLMGGTLTLLIRHLVRRDTGAAGWKVGRLYGVNTAGAALGCLLTDFVLVPSLGLDATQFLAVACNGIAGAGAFYLAHRQRVARAVPALSTRRKGAAAPRDVPAESARHEPPVAAPREAASDVAIMAALALSGFAAMGMEIVWFRHFTIMLGGFRAVFSLLLTIVLVGIGLGSLASGFLYRRTHRAAAWWIVVQALFVASTLAGLALADGRALDRLASAPGHAAAFAPGSWAWLFADLWFNARPMLVELGIPALLMGCGFPLANAIIQGQERSVGRRAGALYLANTVGAVCGSLAAGFLLLPTVGLQASVTVLMMASGFALVPLFLATRPTAPLRPAVAAGVCLLAAASIAAWLALPGDYLIARALPATGEGDRVVNRSEGLNEVITVVDREGDGRTLFTNGHPMSSTARFSQRYMRALAHIPLLSIERPERALVIGFGVGNTAHAATLYPTIARVDVADLSRDILAHADYFGDVNHHVLADPRVAVFINDGRHHLQMQPPGSYDLITLEPPPIGYAGVAALYSREFYELARTRLKANGYMSQWLPSYQVTTETALSMIRAFMDVFPNAVLLSGAHADLILLGTTAPRLEIDPDRLAAGLAGAPAARADLDRLDLGRVREIAGTFIGSAQRLADATRSSQPVTDDKPIQEYGPTSLPRPAEAVPASVVDLSQLASWCPRCFSDGRPVALAQGLDTYMGLLDRAYAASPAELLRARTLAERDGRRIEGSAYLGAIVPESVDVHDYLGIALAQKGDVEGAIVEFEQSLRINPDSAPTHWHLAAALAECGAQDRAIDHLRRSIALDPDNAQARTDLASLLLDARQADAAADQARAALGLAPDSPVAHDSLGVALAMQGHLAEAIDHFQRALALNPQMPATQRNLQLAIEQQKRREKK